MDAMIKQAEWKEYTGSDEQIEEMTNAANGWVLRYSIAGQTDVMYGNPIRQIEFSEHTIQPPFTHYLICNPRPLADMIIRQAQTGQPIYLKFPYNNTIDISKCEFIKHDLGYSYHVTTKPDWNIPGAEYSFTPFDEVEK